MNLEIQKEKEMPLMSRKRITAVATYKGSTPSRLQIRDKIAEKLGVNKEMTVIKHIYTRYGLQKSIIISNIYSKKEDMNTYEDEYLLKKHVEKKEEKKE